MIGAGRAAARRPPVKIAGDFDKVKILEPGGPAGVGHCRRPSRSERSLLPEQDAAGRRNPSRSGATGQYDPVRRRRTLSEKYQHPTPVRQLSAWWHAHFDHDAGHRARPTRIVQVPGRVWGFSPIPAADRIESRPTVVTTSLDPDTSFNGESVAHWEGDTLVVDTIAIDTRMRNISVGRTGDANAWLHSEKEHVIERFSRPSKNYLMHQVTVEIPKCW